MKIKPIETRYKGYRFRSRLEARWAVFLDAINEDWEYEKEGYIVNGTLYLPDFYLPRLGTFLEIKGQQPTREEFQLAESLSSCLGKAVSIHWGEVNQYGRLYCYDTTDSGGGRSDWEVTFCDGKDRCFAYLAFENCRKDREFFSDECFQRGLPVISGYEDYRFDFIEIATDIAKAARFEHGEQPR